jgi:hypothetical protein
MHYNIKHSFEIKPNFIDYLQTSSKIIHRHENILEALRHLNSKNRTNQQSIEFVKTKYKSFACILCEDNQYDSIIKDLEMIIDLHIFKSQLYSKQKSGK